MLLYNQIVPLVCWNAGTPFHFLHVP